MRGNEVIKVLGRKPQVDRLDEDTVQAGASHQVDGCIIWPRTSTELGRGEIVIDGYNVFTPPNADVLASDNLVVRGVPQQVEGVPGDYRLHGRKKGLLVVTKSVASASRPTNG